MNAYICIPDKPENMNTLFPLPLYSFLKTVCKNGGFSAGGVLRSAQWFAGATLFEPLRVIELIAKQKKINQHQISQPPVFILGYYRSGTTYLQEMFKRDDRLGYMSVYQTVFPDIMLTSEKWMTPVMEFFSKLFKHQNVFHRIPFTWYSTGEEDIALSTAMSPVAAHWGYAFPEKMLEYYQKYVMFEGIPAPEFQRWKEDYMLICKKISLANNGRRLVLKNPPNTARIKTLLSLFPDAVFVHIHRNPYEVYASTLKMLKDLQATYSLGHTRNVNHSEVVFNSYSWTMKKYLEEKSLIRPDRLIEVPYDKFIQEPVGTMKSIYEALKLNDFDYCRNKMDDYAEQQKKYSVLKHVQSDDEKKLITEKWGSIISDLDYPIF